MTWGFSESVRARSVPQRWRDFELYVGRLVAGSRRVTFDYGVRYSLSTTRTRTTTRSRASSRRCSTRRWATIRATACCSRLAATGADTGARGGTDGPNGSLMDQDYEQLRAAARLRLGRQRRRQDGGARRRRPVLPARAPQPGPEHREQPAVRDDVSGAPKLDTQRLAVRGCFGVDAGRAPRGPRSRHEDAEQLAVEPHGSSGRSCATRRSRSATSPTTATTCCAADTPTRSSTATSTTTASTTASITRAAGQRRCASSASSANNNIAFWDHDGESTYHSLQTQLVSRFGRGSQFQVSYTLSRSRANVAMTDSRGISRRIPRARQLRTRPRLGRPEPVGPTSSTRRSSGCSRRSKARRADGRALLGDWEIAAIVGAGTGQPFTVYTGRLPGLNGGPVGHRLHRQPAAQHARRAVPRQSGHPTSRSSTRRVHPRTASSSARSATPSAATAPARATSRPTWRSTRTSGSRTA